MSQIETIMLVTLGFVVAALLALFVSRLVWSYAVTLGKRRTERSAPAIIAGLKAERDQLRAEAAMLSRKLELRLDDLKVRLAEQTAEVSRNRNRIDHLIGEVEKRNAAITERDEQIKQLNKHIEPLEIELATRTQAMQQLKEQLRDRDEDAAALAMTKAELEAQIAQRDRELAGLRGEIAKLPRPEDITSQAQSAQQRLQSQISELTTLSRQIEQQRAEMSKQYQEFTQFHTAEPGARLDPPIPPADSRSKSNSRSNSANGNPNSASPGTAQPAAAQFSAGAAGSESDNVHVKVDFLQRQGEHLEKQLLDAERETDQLQDELKKLDDVWAEKVAALNDVAARTTEKRPQTGNAESTGRTERTADEPSDGRSRQNVISLASRIRALQRKSVK